MQIKTAMAATRRSSQDRLLSASRSRGHFHWPSTTNKVTTSEEEGHQETSIDAHPDELQKTKTHHQQRRKLQAMAVSRIKSVLLTAFSGLHTSPQVIGTLFGHRKGHVSFVFQRAHNSSPFFFVELATSITSLVKEMASGLVRIALECNKPVNQGPKKMLEEPVWSTYCNGKKCGFATKRDPGPREVKILKAVEPISMGAGVLPGFNGSGLSGQDGELMYMRAKFERVVGSRDSEAFYMMNPDCNGSPELSIYLLRV